MNEEYIEVKDIPLASAIRKELKRLGISPKNTNVFDFQKFTKEELKSLKRLILINNTYTDISALNYCTNLKDLSIVSLNSKGARTNFTSEAYYSYKSKRTNIKDFSVISSLKSLEFLTIRDDDNLSFLI